MHSQGHEESQMKNTARRHNPIAIGPTPIAESSNRISDLRGIRVGRITEWISIDLNICRIDLLNSG